MLYFPAIPLTQTNKNSSKSLVRNNLEYIQMISSHQKVVGAIVNMKEPSQI
jgi:hypothetical protein